MSVMVVTTRDGYVDPDRAVRSLREAVVAEFAGPTLITFARNIEGLCPRRHESGGGHPGMSRQDHP